MSFSNITSFPKSLAEPIKALLKEAKVKKVLLALSGGADSTALLYGLLNEPVELGIVHIDHSWREESGVEALELKKRYSSIPFYLKKLDPKDISGNLEEGCRLARLDFYRQICERERYEAVFLAHHSDDQAETVL